MARLFGTDGVRGVANRDVTAEIAVELAVAAARVLGERGEFVGHRPTAVLGRDTRISGEFLSAAVAAGLASAGVDVLDAGIVPTPAVAYLVSAVEADLGVVISASHNPMPDNGIKFFARGGQKLDDAVEESIEERLQESWARPTGADVGTITASPDLVRQYVDHVVASAASFCGTDAPAKGLAIVVDCAHGAAFAAAPAALRAAGAAPVVLHADPNGLNINDGVGSTHLGPLRAAVLEAGADFGVALDGDADRCLAVDHLGEVVDGDQIMGVFAVAMKESRTLYRDTLVATVMSNLGLQRAMRAAGIDVVEAAVGDRYVLEAMREGGYTLGGEQSGHVIVSEYASTGDGTLTALLLAGIVATSGRTLRDLSSGVVRLPQVLVNVPGVDRTRVFTDVPLQEAVAAARAELGDAGRILLRPSGTEPLVRVMVEAETDDVATRVAEHLAGIVSSRLGTP
jgi:phosphoglucosamine mutase